MHAWIQSKDVPSIRLPKVNAHRNELFKMFNGSSNEWKRVDSITTSCNNNNEQFY